MKKIITLAAVLLIAHLATAQKVSPDSLAKKEGKTVTVCDKVTGTHVSNGDKKNVSINFGKSFPDNSFSIYITEADLKNFKYNPAEFLKGKNVCVTGVVKIYKDKPEIIVTKEEQIKVE